MFIYNIHEFIGCVSIEQLFLAWDLNPGLWFQHANHEPIALHRPNKHHQRFEPTNDGRQYASSSAMKSNAEENANHHWDSIYLSLCLSLLQCSDCVIEISDSANKSFMRVGVAYGAPKCKYNLTLKAVPFKRLVLAALRNLSAFPVVISNDGQHLDQRRTINTAPVFAYLCARWR